jgi:hypothetical protein
LKSDSKPVDANNWHSKKEDLQSNSIVVGITIDVKPPNANANVNANANAHSSIHCNFAVDAKVIDAGDPKLEKHDVQSNSTDARITIDAKPLNAIADSSNRCNCEFDPNVIDASNAQLEKQNSHKISILNSITTALDRPW